MLIANKLNVIMLTVIKFEHRHAECSILNVIIMSNVMLNVELAVLMLPCSL
jgi:hypothetical protein